jgi:hypothetical protein
MTLKLLLDIGPKLSRVPIPISVAHLMFAYDLPWIPAFAGMNGMGERAKNPFVPANAGTQTQTDWIPISRE